MLRRQIESGNRHDATIAAHTAIQSWTAIVAAVIGTLTTIALIVVTYNQFEISKRQERLDYARAMNQYTVSMKYGAVRIEQLHNGDNIDPDQHDMLPRTLVIERVKGDSAIVSTHVTQYMYLMSPEQYDALSQIKVSRALVGHCGVKVENWFTGSNGRFETPSWLLPLVESGKYDGPNGTIRVVRGKTFIDIAYYDVFGLLKYDQIVIENGRVTMRRDVGIVVDVSDRSHIVPTDDGNFRITQLDANRDSKCLQFIEHSLPESY
jgi:hypothetical protein